MLRSSRSQRSIRQRPSNISAKLLEAVAENDEALMEKYLAGQEPSLEEVKAVIRRATIANEFVPIMCGSALKNKGVQLLLDAVVDFLPSPLEVPEVKGTDPEDPEKEVIRHASDTEPFSASCL